MKLSWRARLQAHPRLADIATWPALDPALLPKQRRGTYRRNTRMIQGVLNGQALAVVAKAEGVSPGRVSQLLNRCLGGTAETGSTPLLRTVLKRLTTFDLERQLYVASWDYETAQCSRIHQLALRSECDSAGGEFALA